MSQPATAFYEKVLTKYGLATFLAVFLVWWVTADVSGAIKHIQASLNEHISENAYYLRGICLNTAQTDAQRANCIPPQTH